MYGYEGWWSFDPVSIGFEAVPTPAQRKGDFSGLLALGSRYQIYDPYSIAPAAGGLFSRQPLPNNIIPANRIDPLGLEDRAALRSAESARHCRRREQLHQRQKLPRQLLQPHCPDRPPHIGQAALLCARECHRNYRVQDQRHSDTVGHILFRYNRGAAIDHVYTVSPSFLINSRYSYTRYIDGNYPGPGRLGPGGHWGSRPPSSTRSMRWIRGLCGFRRSPRAVTPLYRSRPGTRTRSTRMTSP